MTFTSGSLPVNKRQLCRAERSFHAARCPATLFRLSWNSASQGFTFAIEELMSIATLRGWAGVIISLGFFSGIAEIAAAEPPNPAEPGNSAVTAVAVKPADFPLVLTIGLSSEDAEAARILKSSGELKADWRYDKLPLRDVVADFTKRLKLGITIDERDLNEVGISQDDPVTLHAAAISAPAALRLILTELGLTYKIRHGHLLIQTPQEIGPNSGVKKIYLVGDILPRSKSEWGDFIDFDSLNQLIETTIFPTSWGAENSAIEAINWGSPPIRGIYVEQDWEVHAEIERLLRSLHRLRSDFEANPRSIAAPFIDVHGNAQSAFLDKVESRKFSGTVKELAALLTKETGLNVFVDRVALRDVDLSEESKLNGAYTNVSRRSGLKLLLEPLGLTYYTTRDSIVFTNRDVACRPDNLGLRIFPIFDLVGPENALHEANQLAKLVVDAIEPTSWSDVGGSASCVAWYPPALVVSAGEQELMDIERLLADLRQLRAIEVEANKADTTPKSQYVRRVYRLATVEQVNLPSGGFQKVEADERKLSTDEMRSLLELIKRVVSAKSWGDPEVSIEVWRDQLYVRQKPEVLLELEVMLQKLRVWNPPLP